MTGPTDLLTVKFSHDWALRIPRDTPREGILVPWQFLDGLPKQCAGLPQMKPWSNSTDLRLVPRTAHVPTMSPPLKTYNNWNLSVPISRLLPR